MIPNPYDSLIAASKVARRRRKKRTGAAAAELAILLPFVSLMFVVALDFCRIFHHSQTIQNAAMAAALYASGAVSAGSTTSAEDAARQAAVAEAATLDPPLTTEDVSVTVSGATAVVTVTYQMSMLTPIFRGSRTMTITRTVQMNVAPKVGS